MSEKLKVLFISAPIGAGHLRSAQAIATALQEKDASAEFKIANSFDFFSPMLGKWILKFYTKILRLCPWAYAFAYSWGNDSGAALALRDVINRYLAGCMLEYILEYSPHVIVCTHATPAGLCAELLRRNKIHIPVIAVINDFTVHRLWIYPELTRYYVAAGSLKERLVSGGVAPDKISISGIPVHAAFLQKDCKEDILKDLNLSGDIKTILIMGGGWAVMPMDEIVLACQQLSYPVQVIAITGQNRRMFERLSRLQPRFSKPTIILGYSTEIQRFMQVADVIISKPGGLTCAEAMATGLPMLIFRPIPGQEEANAHFLLQHKFAWRADTLAELTAALTGCFSRDAGTFDCLQENLRRLHKVNAADKIASDIFLLAGKGSNSG